jgi:hypothetical protein
MRERLQRSVEEVNIVLIDEAMVAEAEEWLTGCEVCADNAVIALDYLLDALTAYDPSITEYVMCRPACCPFCAAEVTEKTLIIV